MSEITLVIRNARIVDGTGSPSFSGDIAIAGDRIAAIGKVQVSDAPEIDAGGKVVAPGFIDPHTHYDPQLCWDQLATPSPEHGVTSLIIGNCSISLAPVHKNQHQKVIHMFGSVEDMEGRLLEATVPFTWQTVPEYLETLKAGLGPNVGVFVGHSVLRYYAMGAAAQERTATDEELALMCDTLREALRSGAFGLSWSFSHLDECGNELPCFYADDREKLALMTVMAEEGRGMIECAPNLLHPETGLAQIDEFGALALKTGVPCTLSPLLETTSRPNLWRELLERFEYWQAKGSPIYAQTQVRPLDMLVKLSEGSAVLSKMPTWRKALDKDLSTRITFFADANARAEMERELPMIGATIKSFTVKRTLCQQNIKYEGRRVVEIAAAEGRTFTDTFLDIALADRLETEFAQLGLAHTDPEVVSHLLKHPGIHIGSGDAGAHITQFSGVGDTCYLFEKFVRERGDMTLEQGVQRLTSDIARAWRIKDRGEIAVGKFADLVLFDPDRIRRQEEIWVEDVPAASGRYVRHAEGIERVIVNGKILVENGRYLDNRPGCLI